MSPDLAVFAEEALGFKVVGAQVIFNRPGAWSALPGGDVAPRPGARPATPQEISMWRLLTTPHGEWS